jgi:hypothetical protein
MGTNYYVRHNICETCGRYDEYHIGKSSAGWCFSLHVDPENGINDLYDICKLMKRGQVYDEYGSDVTPAQMYSIITERSWENDGQVPHGYQSWKEFHTLNYSEPGPAGLFRHAIDGRHCIGHGEGTYDLIISEFS